MYGLRRLLNLNRLETVCFFAGHALTAEECDPVTEWLHKQIDERIRKGSYHFITALDSEFSIAAAEIVHKRKADYPSLRLIVLLPYAEHYFRDLKLEERLILRAAKIVRKADQVYAVSRFRNVSRCTPDGLLKERMDFTAALCSKMIGLFDTRNNSEKKFMWHVLKQTFIINYLDSSS